MSLQLLQDMRSTGSSFPRPTHRWCTVHRWHLAYLGVRRCPWHPESLTSTQRWIRSTD
jgi:hypothetical protein